MPGDPVEAFSSIVHRSKAEAKGRQMCKRLKDIIPPQLFAVAIQASIGQRVIAREPVRAVRKDVTAKCYGGDIPRTRKRLSAARRRHSEESVKRPSTVDGWPGGRPRPARLEGPAIGRYDTPVRLEGPRARMGAPVLAVRPHTSASTTRPRTPSPTSSRRWTPWR